MNWIDRYTKGTFGLFAGQVLSGFQPLDFYTFLPTWYPLWIARLAKLIRTENLDKKNFSELKTFLPTPSTFRTVLIKIVACYPAFKEKNTEDIKLVSNFFARMLIESCPNDPFAEISNPLHTTEEIKVMLENLPLKQADIEIAKTLGRLNTAAGSLVHGIYNDVVTDFGWDVYGPYHATKDEKELSMLIRHFPEFKALELWSDEFLPVVNEVKIYNLYEDVDWTISAVGCHTISVSGSPVTGMRYYAVYADGKFLNPDEIKLLVAELSEKAEKIYKKIRTMNFEELKEKVVWQESYQFKSLFERFNVDWKPDEGMWKEVRNKPMPEPHLPNDQMMTTLEEYRRIFGVDTFEKEILN